MKKVIDHSEALTVLGYKHESEIQSDIHNFRNVINASDVINTVRFLNSEGYKISKSSKDATLKTTSLQKQLSEKDEEVERLRKALEQILSLQFTTKPAIDIDRAALSNEVLTNKS